MSSQKEARANHRCIDQSPAADIGIETGIERSAAPVDRPRGRPILGDAPNGAVCRDVSGRPRARRPACGRVPAAGADRDGKDSNRGSAGRRAARQPEKYSTRRLRRVSDGARSGQADRRAAGLFGPSRNSTHVDPAEAGRDHQ